MTNKEEDPKKTNTHGTRQWASGNVNIQNGCQYGCKYCYANAFARRFSREPEGGWRCPQVREHKVAQGRGRHKGQIMFPSTHDIVPANLDACSIVLNKLLRAKNQVLIVTKPAIRCIERLCRDLDEFKSQILFRFTITSVDNRTLKYWEPGAPGFEERIECLKHAFEHGYETSISCEPLLDGNVDALIEAVRPYTTHSVWLGPASRLAPTVARNCPGDDSAAEAAAKLVRVWDADALRALYAKYKDDKIIRWKNSIKKIVGLPLADAKGLDI